MLLDGRRIGRAGDEAREPGAWRVGHAVRAAGRVGGRARPRRRARAGVGGEVGRRRRGRVLRRVRGADGRRRAGGAVKAVWHRVEPGRRRRVCVGRGQLGQTAFAFVPCCSPLSCGVARLRRVSEQHTATMQTNALAQPGAQLREFLFSLALLPAVHLVGYSTQNPLEVCALESAGTTARLTRKTHACRTSRRSLRSSSPTRAEFASTAAPSLPNRCAWPHYRAYLDILAKLNRALLQPDPARRPRLRR